MQNLNFSFNFFDNLKEIYCVLEKDGTILNCNNLGRKIFGLSEEDYGKTKIINFIAEQNIKSVEETLEQVFAENETKEIQVKIINGENVYNAELNFFLYKEKRKKYCVLKGRDSTKEKQRELELLPFFYVAENTVNPLQITDLEGKMVYVNPAFVTSSGFSKKELIGSKPNIFGSGKHPKKFWDNMWSTIRNGKVWVGEVENRRKSGEPFYTQLLISPILDGDSKVTGFFGIHRDLTEKKLLEQQLIHTQKMESIGTLAAGIAHEVGNPLASISALVQVAERYTEEEFVKDKLGLVKSQVTRISKIIRDLVDFSRPSNYELLFTDVNTIINEAIEIVRVGAKAKDVEFIKNLDPKIPHVSIVPDQLQQVFVNILLNAVDAIVASETKSGDGKIEVNSYLDENNNLIIKFSDNGEGIKEEHKMKIFEPFFTTKKEGKGTGLGLWVSYGIVKSFQGDILLHSKENEGTVFTVILPTIE